MRDNRISRRYMLSDSQCFFPEEKTPRMVMNLSMGGMLVEKLEDDSSRVGDAIAGITVIVDGQSQIFDAKVVRVQEKSLGMVFTELKEQDMGFLFKVLANRS